jgi:hypothetical protein
MNGCHCPFDGAKPQGCRDLLTRGAEPKHHMDGCKIQEERLI